MLSATLLQTLLSQDFIDRFTPEERSFVMNLICNAFNKQVSPSLRVVAVTQKFNQVEGSLIARLHFHLTNLSTVCLGVGFKWNEETGQLERFFVKYMAGDIEPLVPAFHYTQNNTNNHSGLTLKATCALFYESMSKFPLDSIVCFQRIKALDEDDSFNWSFFVLG